MIISGGGIGTSRQAECLPGERRMTGNRHVRCGAGEKSEAQPETDLLPLGIVPDFKKKLATARSRSLGMSILYQNIPQLQNRYPDGQWEEILGGCDVSLFLGCNDMTTATYFSERSGDVTVGVASLKKNLSTVRMSNYVPEYSETSSVGRRKLLLPDEILRFPLDEELVIIRGQKVLRAKKLDYTKLPESKRLMLEKTECHIPEWRRKKETSNPLSEPLKWEECTGEPYRDEMQGQEDAAEKTEETRGQAEERASGIKPEAMNEELNVQEKIDKVEDLFTDDW